MMARRPATVAIVLSNYNHARYLPESLGAICGQTRQADEILISEGDMVGRTAAELRALHFARDRQYLQRGD